MQTIQEAYGAEMIGVEPGNAYRKLAEEKASNFTLPRAAPKQRNSQI
jgi:hypothetical protein